MNIKEQIQIVKDVINKTSDKSKLEQLYAILKYLESKVSNNKSKRKLRIKIDKPKIGKSVIEQKTKDIIGETGKIETQEKIKRDLAKQKINEAFENIINNLVPEKPTQAEKDLKENLKDIEKEKKDLMNNLEHGNEMEQGQKASRLIQIENMEKQAKKILKSQEKKREKQNIGQSTFKYIQETVLKKVDNKLTKDEEQEFYNNLKKTFEKLGKPYNKKIHDELMKKSENVAKDPNKYAGPYSTYLHKNFNLFFNNQEIREKKHSKKHLELERKADDNEDNEDNSESDVEDINEATKKMREDMKKAGEEMDKSKKKPENKVEVNSWALADDDPRLDLANYQGGSSYEEQIAQALANLIEEHEKNKYNKMNGFDKANMRLMNLANKKKQEAINQLYINDEILNQIYANEQQQMQNAYYQLAYNQLSSQLRNRVNEYNEKNPNNKQ